MVEVAAGTGRKNKLPDFDIIWDYDHPGASERRFRELLPAALDSRDLPYLSQLLTQVARAEGLQRKFDAAHKTLDRVQKALATTDDRTRVRYLLERGRVFNSAGKRDDSRPCFLVVLYIAINYKDDLFAIYDVNKLARVNQI